MIRAGMQAIDQGANPILLKRGMERAIGRVIPRLNDMGRTISGRAEMAHVASISANDDGDVGDVIAEALDAVGLEGIITVEEWPTYGMEVEVTEGYKFVNGFVSPYMVTDESRMEAVHDDPYILLTCEKITTAGELMPLLDKIMRAPRPLVIMAEAVEGSALGMLVSNHVHGNLRSVAVRGSGGVQFANARW